MYIFDSTDGGDTFFETAILIASDASKEVSFGSSVFLGNKVLIVGAPGDDAMGEASGTTIILFLTMATQCNSFRLQAHYTFSKTLEVHSFGVRLAN